MPGIHHVTAISGKAAQNLAFYTGTLGLRLVKKTVNFDDPGTWHFYYGDEQGSPGTILTFFPWEHAAEGRNGVGQAEQTAFRVPAASMGYWAHRFVAKGVVHGALEKRFGEPVLPFTDPHGMSLALVGVAEAAGEPAWTGGDVPAEHAIRGIHGATLMLHSAAPTAAILTGALGFRETGRDGSLTRFEAGQSGAGNVIVLREAGGFLGGRQGKGSVHHIAFRATDDAAQAAMVEALRANNGIVTTGQKDRNYFRSVYFREPGGVLFEIATDAPGFTADEPLASLGHGLKLPAFLEPRRDAIARDLPEV